MNFISMLRFDVIAAIAFVLIVAISTIKNQRKVWRRTLCLLFAMGIVGLFVYFNFFSLYTVFCTYIAAFANWFFSLIKAPTLAPLVSLIIVGATLLVVILLDLLFNGFILLISGSDKKKYQKYPSYAVTYKPVLSFIGGVIKGLLVVYFMYFVWMNLSGMVGIDNSTDFLLNIVGKFEPVLKRMQELINQVLQGA